MPGGFVCSASMSAAAQGDVREAVATAGARSASCSPRSSARSTPPTPRGHRARRPSVLGPIFVLKLKSRPTRFGRRMVAEFWLYPDGTRILELSTKCLPAQTFQTAVEARSFLRGTASSLSGEQNAKTRKALDIYSARLLAEATAAAKAAAHDVVRPPLGSHEHVRQDSQASRTAAPKPRSCRKSVAPKPRARKPAG